MSKKTFAIFMVFYTLMCHAPFFVPALNKVTPWLGFLPFTLWSALALNLIGCIVMYIASRSTWKVPEK